MFGIHIIVTAVNAFRARDSRKKMHPQRYFGPESAIFGCQSRFGAGTERVFNIRYTPKKPESR